MFVIKLINLYNSLYRFTLHFLVHLSTYEIKLNKLIEIIHNGFNTVINALTWLYL